jgi:hypothetical protein
MWRTLVRPQKWLALAAFLALVIGLWAALLRLGWNLPWLQPNLALAHGPLMVGGFLGTLIGLERAVALGRRWAYLAPALTALGAAALVVGIPGLIGPLLIFAGSVVLTAVFCEIVRRQRAMFTVTMAGGAVAWAVGNALWLGGIPIPEMVHWWMAFLILTIVGERLELSRFLAPTPNRAKLFAVIVAIYVAGLVATLFNTPTGRWFLGLGMVALAAWLARYDIARFTVRQRGLPRFAAVCLLSGYAWLSAGGVLALFYGRWPSNAELAYDAMLHTVFLGFVFSMIFAHAPIILPSVTRLELPYRPAFYAHFLLLELSLVWRISGDCLGSPGAYRWGGLFNVVAVLVFLGSTGHALIVGARKQRPIARATVTQGEQSCLPMPR